MLIKQNICGIYNGKITMTKIKNDNLYKFSKQTPWQFALVVLLYLVGSTGFPISIFTFFLGDSLNAKLIAIILARLICCVLPIYLVYEIKLERIFSLKGFFYCFLLIIPFLLVAINNFPIIPLAGNDVSLTDNRFITWFLYAISVLFSVSLEEITFRGLILPTIYRKLKSNKNAQFLSVFISSALLGLAHLFNLFAGAGIGSVIMQIGYSFLIGGMCAIAFIKTGNFYNCIILHFIFNLGGLLYDYNLIKGNIWTVENVIVTAVLAVIVIIYAVIILLKNNDKTFENKVICEED